ncbi:putative ribonuclease H-like domain-containing protein [Tanacetum coccineum]
MVRNMIKDKSKVFKTPTQSKTSGEEDINPTTLEAAKTMSKVASQRSKSVDNGQRYREEKKSPRDKDIDTWLLKILVTGFEDMRFSTGSGPVSSARGQREGKESSNELLKRLKLPKEIKKQLQQEEASPYRIHKIANVVKALYGLHQVPRAWYATLSTFLEKHGYRRGTIDKTLFIKKDEKDIMLLSIVSMGELIFFLGLQVKQKTDGIFISQDKYVADMLKKFDLASVKTAITLNGVPKMAFTKDEEG